MLESVKLNNVHETGKKMVFLVKNYARDIGDLVNMSIYQFFDFVKNLPYMPDHPKAEIVHRPGYTITNSVKFRDCDDKMVLFGSYLYLKNIVFRFVACSQAENYHLSHVLIEAILGGVLTKIDPTYKRNNFKSQDYFTYCEPISEWIIK